MRYNYGVGVVGIVVVCNGLSRLSKVDDFHII